MILLLLNKFNLLNFKNKTIMKDIKDFIWECMLFQNPKEGNIISNWQLGIYSWINVSIILLGAYSLIKKH